MGFAKWNGMDMDTSLIYFILKKILSFILFFQPPSNWGKNDWEGGKMIEFHGQLISLFKSDIFYSLLFVVHHYFQVCHLSLNT